MPSPMEKKMANEILTFETAVALGKLICPPAFESRQSLVLLTVEEISNELGIHLNTVKRWIAESVFVPSLPVKTLIAEDFSPDDGLDPMEVLAFYVFCRLGVKYQQTLSQDWGENAQNALQCV